MNVATALHFSGVRLAVFNLKLCLDANNARRSILLVEL